jgi:hypothetical protein
MKQIDFVFLDLDGVVFDFHSVVGDQLNDKEKWWNEGFPAFIDVGGFADLPLLPYAYELIEFLCENVNVNFLSSAGGASRFEEIVDQKLEALRKNGIDLPTIIVPSKGIKKQFARENYLLIDDQANNCQDFIEAGGEAIVHVDVKTTIAYIKEHYFLKGKSHDQTNI